MRLGLLIAVCIVVGCNAKAEIKGVERTQQNQVTTSQPVDIVEGMKDLIDLTTVVKTSLSRLVEINSQNEAHLKAIAEVKVSVAGINSEKNYGVGDSVPMRIAMIGSILMGVVFLVGFFQLLRWVWPKRVAS